jgi:hypothetical protein
MDELERLTELCHRLGASDATQARTMASQLMKRADQLAAERAITREAAMQHLLTVMVHGRRGELPPGFAASPPAAPN